MESRLARTLTFSTVTALVAVAAVILLAGGALAQGPGQPIVELRYNGSNNVTRPSTFPSQKISGTDTATRQEYKFQRQRESTDFSYVVANLVPSAVYSVELSFVEHDQSASGKRVFNVYCNGTNYISRLDIYARVGKNSAYQKTFTAQANSKGLLEVRLRSDESGCRDLATVSTMRLYKGSANAVEINAAKSRLTMDVPTRFTNASGQDSFETALGRLGSRLSLNLVPQKLGARFSSLGDGTGDLSDLILGLSDGSKMRCLPFTDRYPVWESMALSQTMTSQTYTCSSSTVPFEVKVEFKSPFYPGQEKLSSAPFFYVDVTVKNTGVAAASPSFVFAKPHKQDFASSTLTEFGTLTKVGYQGKTTYNYYDETYNKYRIKTATEALALPAAEAPDVDFKAAEAEFGAFDEDALWGYASPAGYPRTYVDYKKPLYSFYPRGYSGAVWTITGLAPGESRSKHFVMAGYINNSILKVRNTAYTDQSFKYKYCSQFASVQAVVDYAVTNRGPGPGTDDIEGRSGFFDSTLSSEEYLSLPPAYGGAVKNLIAYSFQSYLMNTWWARSASSGREWFSVWEGSSCRYHSTVDVEYNNAWFYFQFWPDLLKKEMDEWVLYLKTAQQGTYLSHDMGVGDEATGQAYPNSMAVEENTNFILLLYKYWKVTGDTAYMEQMFPTVRKLVDFVIECDTNNNGLPDQYTWNTIDQGSLAIQFSKNPSYLGMKCLAAHQAAREMASSLSSPDPVYAARCGAQVEAINQTFEYDMWLSDHFAVCVDDDVLAEDREAYSIYPSNGLVYLLGGTRAAGLTSTNTARVRADLIKATAATLKTYGCTHSSYDAYNQWVSQNLWRDQAASMLGVKLNGQNPLALSERYWSLEQYFAKSLWGTFWDVVVYPGGTGGGPSERLTPASAGRSGAAAPRRAAASSYEQSLGYYPRGAASLGLIDAAAGLTLDRVHDALYYQQTTYPLKVPVFSLADWDNPDPGSRVPTLKFTNASGSPVIVNRGLLPGTVARRNVSDVQDVTVGGHALSPNGDGVNDTATISYTLPLASTVGTSVWESSDEIRSFPEAAKGKGRKSFTWDGKTGGGAVVGDGIYTARIDARPTATANELRPAGAPVFVNNSIPDLSRDWYLAEGYTGHSATGGEFEQYVLVQNPGQQAANVGVTFMLAGGATVQRSYIVPAQSRFTITVDEILPDAEVSTHLRSDEPIAVERAMYFNGRKAGHDSIGVSCPSKTWYLAEGYTADSFDEYVLIQNPGDQEADITATFMTPGAGNEAREYRVGPHSRFTIHVDDIIPAQSVSTRIESSQPVVVERAQYLNDMKSGTCSIGAVSASRTWYLAEGYTDQGFEEWVLIQNPQKTYNEVTVTFMEGSGANTVKQYRLPPESRFTILVDAYLEASEVSVKVRAEHPLLVERAMYWNNRSDGHACIGTPTPDSVWYLAEGYTDQGFETWVLVQNPGDEARNVTMTFMEPGGRNTTRVYTVQPRSRFTVGVDEILPAAEVSTRVSADGPIIVERAIYFDNRSGGTDSLGIRGN